MMEIIFRPFFWPLINVALGLLTALQFNFHPYFLIFLILQVCFLHMQVA